jgi:hypothetical protein
LIIEVNVDGKAWIKLDVKEPLGIEALNEIEAVYQKITKDSNKNNINSSQVMRMAVHQLRKKYG